MMHLAIVRGLTYASFSQVFNRWLMPIYRSAFRWTGNRLDAEDATTLTFLKLAGGIQLPELVQVVDDQLIDAGVEAVTRHWVDGYGIARVRSADIHPSQASVTLQALFAGLPAEMRLALVLRFVRRRSLVTIGTQLGIHREEAKRRISAALAGIAVQIGFAGAPGEDAQPVGVWSYIDDIIAGRRPGRFEVTPQAWPLLIAAAHLQAAIAGNDLPTREFVRALDSRLETARRRSVTELRIWSA